MTPKIYPIMIAASIAVFSSAAQAQIVSDPEVEANTGVIATEMKTADKALVAIDATTARTLLMMNTPTATLASSVLALDAGGARETASDGAEYVPQLNGATPTSAWSTQLLEAERAAILTDQAKGLIQGDSAVQEAERERLVGTNLQGEVYADDLVYAARFLAADTMLTRLSTANIKDAIVLSGGIQVEILKQLSLLGQSISTNTAAVTESWISKLKAFFQYKEDHTKTALAFAI